MRMQGMTSMATRFVVAAFAVVTAVAVTAPAVADETGLAGALHTLKKQGKFLCMEDHFHYMTGNTVADKKKAIASAIDNWQSFTAAEYGTDWAYFRKAGSKKITCNPGASGFSCSVEGRPCK